MQHVIGQEHAISTEKEFQTFYAEISSVLLSIVFVEPVYEQQKMVLLEQSMGEDSIKKLIKYYKADINGRGLYIFLKDYVNYLKDSSHSEGSILCQFLDQELSKLSQGMISYENNSEQYIKSLVKLYIICWVVDIVSTLSLTTGEKCLPMQYFQMKNVDYFNEEASFIDSSDDQDLQLKKIITLFKNIVSYFNKNTMINHAFRRESLLSVISMVCKNFSAYFPIRENFMVMNVQCSISDIFLTSKGALNSTWNQALYANDSLIIQSYNSGNTRVGCDMIFSILQHLQDEICIEFGESSVLQWLAASSIISEDVLTYYQRYFVTNRKMTISITLPSLEGIQATNTTEVLKSENPPSKVHQQENEQEEMPWYTRLSRGLDNVNNVLTNSRIVQMITGSVVPTQGAKDHKVKVYDGNVYKDIAAYDSEEEHTIVDSVVPSNFTLRATGKEDSVPIVASPTIRPSHEIPVYNAQPRREMDAYVSMNDLGKEYQKNNCFPSLSC